MRYTKDDKISAIKEAIEKAKNNHSKLTAKELDLQGFTSHKIKHLINNLGSISKVYGEVGVHKGAMTIAATFENKCNNTSSWVCDNWTLFEEGGRSKQMFYELKDTYGLGIKVFEQDCFTIDLKQISKTDFYIYDGSHDKASQQKGIEYFYPVLANTFIFICDDFSWEEPRLGTEQAIKNLKLKILFHEALWDGKENGEYHNGIGIYLLKK